MNQYRHTEYGTEELDPQKWADESFDIAQHFVYNGVKENEALKEKYIEEGRRIAEKRIATAGYRLANLLMSLKLSSNN